VTKWQNIWLTVLRLGMGWVYFYAGWAKLTTANWSAAGYLNNAKTFPDIFAWFASDANLGWVNFINMWGLTLIGAALILGVAVKFASAMGALLTLLYYFPILDFPKAGANGYIIDDHIIYVMVFGVLAVFAAGRIWGLDGWLEKKGFFKKMPWLSQIWG